MEQLGLEEEGDLEAEEGEVVLQTHSNNLPSISPVQRHRQQHLISEGTVLLPAKKTVKLAPTLPNVLTDPPVGGRLQHFWESWERMGVEDSIVDLVKEGYKLILIEKPPLSRVPFNIQLPQNPNKKKALLEIVQDLLGERVIEIVTNTESPGYYNHFFITTKSTPGKWRPILDLKQFNHHMLKERFKMETAESIRESLNIGEWATSLDFTSAYHHIPIHKSSRKYLRFAIDNIVYQYRALPMGLTSSARVFTKVIKAVQGLVQVEGIDLHQYLDDWLVRA